MADDEQDEMDPTLEIAETMPDPLQTVTDNSAAESVSDEEADVDLDPDESEDPAGEADAAPGETSTADEGDADQAEEMPEGDQADG